MIDTDQSRIRRLRESLDKFENSVEVETKRLKGLCPWAHSTVVIYKHNLENIAQALNNALMEVRLEKSKIFRDETEEESGEVL